MLVDLRVRGETVVVVGSGEAARSRAQMLRREGAKVIRVRDSVPSPKRRAGPSRRPSRSSPSSSPVAVVSRTRPRIVFVTSWKGPETEAIVQSAHAVGALAHVYDTPQFSDFTMPSIGRAGAIRFAVSTSGQSPAMAVLLRQRMGRTLRPIDVARVRLQGSLRGIILRSLPTREGRREAIYRILRSREIDQHLRAHQFKEAVALARRIVARCARAQGGTTRPS